MAKYKFEGYTITCCGYHQPDHCVWWEAVDDSGSACFHATTLRGVEFMILDHKWYDKLKAKDREIEELRGCLKEVVGCADEFQKFYETHPYLCKYTRDVVKKIRKALEGANDETK